MKSTDINRGLEDLSFVAKRFSGLLSLADNLKELGTLLNQVDEMTKIVAQKQKEAAELDVKVSKAKEALSSLQKQSEEIEKAHKKTIADKLKEVKTVEAKIEQASVDFNQELVDIDAARQERLQAAQAEFNALLASKRKEVEDLTNQYVSVQKKLEAIKKVL